LRQGQHFGFTWAKDYWWRVGRQYDFRHVYDWPLLTLPEQAYGERIGRAAHESLCYSLIVDSTWNLHLAVQVSQKVKPVQFAQRHQRAGVA